MTTQNHTDNDAADNNDAELLIALQRRREEILTAVENVPGPRRPVQPHVVYGVGAAWGSFRYGGGIDAKP